MDDRYLNSVDKESSPAFDFNHRPPHEGQQSDPPQLPQRSRVTDVEVWENSRLCREKMPRRLLVHPDLAEFAA